MDRNETFATPAQRLLARLTPSYERPVTYHLTREAYVRGMGFIYLVGFWILVRQYRPLLGERGLLPVPAFMDFVEFVTESTWDAFWEMPSLFFIADSDPFAMTLAWLGVVLSLLVIAGRSNAIILVALWALYLSFVNVGQRFYGYGWEVLVCEAGFLAVFLRPLNTTRPMTDDDPTPTPVIWLTRWLTFRVMFGAGLIKLRGDPCWDELTCMSWHYETQPNPNPLSWWFHHLPMWVDKAAVVINHVVELGVPFLIFGPRPVRHAAGLAIIAFQVTLILSGNLAFLNWLTIVVALGCFDDAFYRRLLPTRWRGRADERAEAAPRWWPHARVGRRIAVGLLTVTVVVLSVNPTLNLFSREQAMNSAYDPFNLVNTYGAFGSVDRDRYEIVLLATLDEEPTEDADWEAYRFRCKPGEVDRSPCWISPYHLRLDWQMWFAYRQPLERNTWFIRMVHLLLHDEPMTERLFAEVPFDGEPPRWIRADLYRYRFTDQRGPDGVWWDREYLEPYLPPVSADNPSIRALLLDVGLLEAPP